METSAVIPGQEGWKHKYSLKEWKANKSKLYELAKMLPSPLYRTTLLKVPGFELLAYGLTHWKNEPIIPWYEYPIKEHELVDHVEMLKNIFMDRGMYGVNDYVSVDVPVYADFHRRAFPNLYRNSKPK